MSSGPTPSQVTTHQKGRYTTAERREQHSQSTEPWPKENRGCDTANQSGNQYQNHCCPPQQQKAGPQLPNKWLTRASPARSQTPTPTPNPTRPTLAGIGIARIPCRDSGGGIARGGR